MSSLPWLFTTQFSCLCQQPDPPSQMQLGRYPASSKELKATPVRRGVLLCLPPNKEDRQTEGNSATQPPPSGVPKAPFCSLAVVSRLFSIYTELVLKIL